MNQFSQKRGILQVLLAAIVAAFICSITPRVATAQPIATVPAQCGEYTRPASVTLPPGRTVSALAFLAGTWDGLSNAEFASYLTLTRAETPRRIFVRAWPTRDAAFSASWTQPTSSTQLLTLGRLIADNPGKWSARHHRIMTVDVPADIHIARGLSVSVTENFADPNVANIPVPVGFRRDRVDVTTIGQFSGNNATATRPEQLFIANEWFRLPAGALSRRAFSTWKVESSGRTYQLARLGTRRALQRSCEALPRLDSVIASEDRAQLAELLVELDGVGSDPDAQADLQSAVTTAHTRVVEALSTQLRPDREAIASANAGRDGFENAAKKNAASARAWRRTFHSYRTMIVTVGRIVSAFIFALCLVILALLLKKPMVIMPRDSDPGHPSSLQGGEVIVKTVPNEAMLNARYDAGYAAGGATFGIHYPGTNDIIPSDAALVELLDATKKAAKAEGVAEGKASAPTPEAIEQMRVTARQAGHDSRNEEVRGLSGRVNELEIAARGTGISNAAKVRELEAERDGLSEKVKTLSDHLDNLIIFALDVSEIVFGYRFALVEGQVPNPKGLANQVEKEVLKLRGQLSRELETAHSALRDILKEGGKAKISRLARRGLGQKVEETGTQPQAREYNDRMTKPGPAPAQSDSGVVRTAPELADDHPTEKIADTAELLAAVIEEVEVELEEEPATPTPTNPNEDYRLAAKLFNAGFRRFYGRIRKGETDGSFAPGAAHAVGQAVSVLRNMLESYGYELEAIDLSTNFQGCPEINWSTAMGTRDRSNGATTQLVDVTPDGRTPQRLVIDRYCAIASFMNRVVNGGTEVSLKPEVKAIFSDEIKTLTDELRAANNNFAADALVDGLSNTSKSVRTGALPIAKAKVPAPVQKTA